MSTGATSARFEQEWCLGKGFSGEAQHDSNRPPPPVPISLGEAYREPVRLAFKQEVGLGGESFRGEA